MGPRCLQANLERYFPQGLVTGNYSALKLTSLGKASFLSLDNSSLHLQDKTEKKKKKWQKGMPEETVEVTLCSPEGPLHFLLQREHGKHTYLDNGFGQHGQTPHILTHKYHWVYVKGVKAGTFTNALCPEVWLQIKPGICMRRKGSFTSS